MTFLLIAGCSEPYVEGGEIQIRNDLLDKEYNSFQIDSVVAKNGAMPFRKVLKPGEGVTLPFKGVRSLRVIRRYPDHSKVYVVQCPADFDRKVTMKLIDIHSNRLSGGCVLSKRGKQERGGLTKWD